MRLRSILSAIAGVVAGLIAFELSLGSVATVQLPVVPDIARDSFAGPVITSKQIDEGIGTSHYSAGGARLTGKEPIDGAPVIALLGDSYVVAREVSDDATMGAWVERLASEAGTPVNVRQYGWRGAGPAQYFAVAADLKERWNPPHVVVVLSDDDLDAHAVTTTIPHMRVMGDSSVRLVNLASKVAAPADTALLERSRLLLLARRRTALLGIRARNTTDRWRRRLRIKGAAANATDADVATSGSLATVVQQDAPPDSAEISTVPGAVVRELERKFGTGLIVVYVAHVPIGSDNGASPAPLEARLLDACARRHVRCASTRDSMVALDRRGIIARGFSTTTLGDGHLNDAGHEMMGRLIWSLVSKQ